MSDENNVVSEFVYDLSFGLKFQISKILKNPYLESLLAILIVLTIILLIIVMFLQNLLAGMICGTVRIFSALGTSLALATCFEKLAIYKVELS